MDLGSLKVKRLSDILSELIDYTSMHTDQITDFTQGSVIRSIYESISLTLEELYQLSTENVTWAIDHAILDAFDFTPKEAQNSFGNVTVDLYSPLTTDVVLGRGTSVFSTSQNSQSLYFRTQQSYLIPQGTTSFEIEVVCNTAGAKSNIPANYIDAMSTTQLSVLKVTNEDPFLTGRDEETADELKKRFREFVATRGRGTERSIIYGINTIPEITGCFLEQHTGYFDIYAHDANGNLSDSTKAKCYNMIEEYKSAGVGYKLLPLNKVKISLNINLAVTDVDLVTDAFQEGLRQYIIDYLNHFNAGDDLIVSNVIEKVLSYSSIIRDVQFIGGATYTTAPEEIIRSGNIYITTDTKPNFNGKNEVPADDVDEDTDTDETPTVPDESDGGTKLLGFVYYNSSNNYSRTESSTTPVSVTYYDANHVIITTLPYDLGFDPDKDLVRVEGNKYTVLDDYNVPIRSLSYDNTGSIETVFDTTGSIITQTQYDNYGRVTALV